MVLEYEVSRRIIMGVSAIFCLTAEFGVASERLEKCADRRFGEIISRTKINSGSGSHAVYFYEPEIRNELDHPNSFSFMNGRLYIDTRGGDLYSSEYKYHKSMGGFMLRRIVYATEVDRGSFIFPKYGNSCSSVESLDFLRSRQVAGEKPELIRYTRRRKCHLPIGDKGYAWIEC